MTTLAHEPSEPTAVAARPTDLDDLAADVPAPATTLTSRPSSAPLPPRRKLGGFSRAQLLDILGAGLAALCITTLLFGHLAPLSGAVGFVAMTYLLFLALYAVLTSINDNGPVVRDRIATVLLYSAGAVLLCTLILVVGFTLWRGHTAFFHWNFFTQDMSTAGPLDPLTVGGIKHAIFGSLIMIAIALVITVPLGILCAVYLTQVGGRGSRFIKTMVEAMTALPSIVAGLFIFATWILILGFERSGLAAALALSVMMLPIIIRSADVVLRLVPGNLVEAAEGLGAPRWRTVWHVVLPTSRSGLATAVILGTARGIGETSPVLLTAGYSTFVNTNPTKGPMVSLPLAVFELVRSPQQAYVARGFAAAAFLMLLVLALFVVARLVGGRGPGQFNKRQQRRMIRQSAHDLERISARTSAPKTDASVGETA